MPTESTGLTFQNLQDQVLSYGYGEADRTNVKGWINEAQREVVAKRRWSWNEATIAVATVAGTQTTDLTALSPSPMFVGRMRPNGAGFDEPEYTDYFTGDSDSFVHAYHPTTERGIPTHFSIHAGLVIWDPTPVAVYNYTLSYWARATDMSSNGDYSLVPAAHRNTLIYGALYRACLRDRNPAMAEQYMKMYADALGSLEAAEGLRQKNTPDRVKVPRRTNVGVF